MLLDYRANPVSHDEDSLRADTSRSVAGWDFQNGVDCWIGLGIAQAFASDG